MNLTEGTIAILNDAKVFLEQINTEKYNFPIPAMSNATVGQHTRHFIEFYQCLLAQASTGGINYSLRKRDIRMEQHPQIALKAIDVILETLIILDFEKPVVLSSSKEGAYTIKSTLAREIYYNIEHCIHHLALIKVALYLIAPEIQLPEHFGIAPSTLQYRASIKQPLVQ